MVRPVGLGLTGGLGRMTIRITVRGADAIARALGDTGAVAKALADGLRAGATLVERRAKLAVHSPDNPYIGKAGRNIATGRLQASLGQSDVTGTGLEQSIRVGTPYGKTGAAGSTFARSRKGGGFTGGRRNRSDPNVYGPIEERKHPFLGPSVTENADEIAEVIGSRIRESLERSMP